MTSGAVVLLDFGGTLDADGVPWMSRFYREYRAVGGRLEEEGFRTAFQESDRRLETHAGIRRLGFRAMIEAQAQILAGLLPDEGLVARSLADRFHRRSRAALERNRRVLAELRRDGHRLGLVSNFTGNLAVCLHEVGLARYFETVCDSALVGWLKPDPRIFRAARAALASRRGTEVWMVGDNPDADIRPAARLGFRTVWIAPSGRRLPPGLHPTARINTLGKLPHLLRRHARAHPRGR